MNWLQGGEQGIHDGCCKTPGLLLQLYAPDGWRGMQCASTDARCSANLSGAEIRTTSLSPTLARTPPPVPTSALSKRTRLRHLVDENLWALFDDNMWYQGRVVESLIGKLKVAFEDGM